MNKETQQKAWNVLHQLKSIHTMMMGGRYQKALYMTENALWSKLKALHECSEWELVPEEVRLTEEMSSECVSAIVAAIQMVFVMRSTGIEGPDGVILECKAIKQSFQEGVVL